MLAFSDGVQFLSRRKKIKVYTFHHQSISIFFHPTSALHTLDPNPIPISGSVPPESNTQIGNRYPGSQNNRDPARSVSQQWLSLSHPILLETTCRANIGTYLGHGNSKGLQIREIQRTTPRVGRKRVDSNRGRVRVFSSGLSIRSSTY
jgi:hypothetical protein